MNYITLLGSAIFMPVVMLAQDVSGNEFSEAIEDNSFFIEEAFNQERGIVQHISTLIYFRSPSQDLMYGLTQEWPLWSQTHQLSFTIPYMSLAGGTLAGVGDILINYRYQLTDSRAWATAAPRLSFLLPTGRREEELGSDVVGLQLNLPVSKRLSEAVIAHANAGVTILPGVDGTERSGAPVEKTIVSYNVGGSVILLAEQWINFLLEGNVVFQGNLVDGEVVHSTEHVVSPGIRMAFDIGSLQIVPGLGIPFSIVDGATQAGMFLYLSFEHPF